MAEFQFTYQKKENKPGSGFAFSPSGIIVAANEKEATGEFYKKFPKKEYEIREVKGATVDILYEYNGNKVDVESLRDPTVLGAGKKLLNALNGVECANPDHPSRVTIVVSGGDGGLFSVKTVDPCCCPTFREQVDKMLSEPHPKFFE